MAKQYNVAGFDLYFPDDHLLEKYQSIWHLYDRALGIIVKFISTKYPKMTAIDIGANVGDSAALIQEFQTIPTLCVEGNPEYLKYLEENAKIIGNIEIADCFIGDDGLSVALDAMENYSGTTSIVNAISTESSSTSQMRSLQSLLVDFPRFQDSKLLKIDTDGLDFKIIRVCEAFIKQVNPIIYFEYDTSSIKDGCLQGLETIEFLADLGYQKFAIYDNFGNYMVSLDHRDRQYFIDLTNYLFSSCYKSGKPVIYYYDICAFTEVDLDILRGIHPESTIIN